MSPIRRHESLVEGWEFRRLDTVDSWSPVALPHNPCAVDLDGNNHWRGLCQYRRVLQIAAPQCEGIYSLYFAAAMHTAEVRIDGEFVGRHRGGYLPFEVPLGRWVADGNPHELLVELDNRDDPDVPPGKALDALDFCWYGGLYRSVELRCLPRIRITDAVAADEAAGGGIFIRTVFASTGVAQLAVRVHVANGSDSSEELTVCIEILEDDHMIARANSKRLVLGSGKSAHVDFELEVVQAKLWSPRTPHLYDVRASLVAVDGTEIDQASERFGIRTISMSRSDGLRINGERYRPRGTNRHQDYPWIGYALSDAAQFRDAKKIKEAGFDFVRSSHYPQSPAFLDACDALGILIMNCVPGWQYMGGEVFRAACYRNARDLIRRDRNHASVILWELSLNETLMDEAFMLEMGRIGHEEYPGDQMYTCGWIDAFDVFIHSRQHGRMHAWANEDKAMVVAEYGDWEFYAANQGFDQTTGEGLLADWSNSRGLRGDGERKLLQQVRNHLTALNDTLSSSAICDGVWSMFDYPRGYDSKRAACGVMDIFRLPKFSYHFYRSQRSPEETGLFWRGGPMVFIASHWTPASSLDLLVFSNCEEVELSLNGKSLARQLPSRTSANQNLPHPPFVFHASSFEAGVLEAAAYLKGERVATHVIATPGAPKSLLVEIDEGGVAEGVERRDCLLAHARVLDGNGQLCVASQAEVTFEVDEGACIEGPATVRMDAGIASIVVVRHAGQSAFCLRARSFGFAEARCHYRVPIEADRSEMQAADARIEMLPRIRISRIS